MTFDPASGVWAKLDGMHRVASAANPEWWQFMAEATVEVARRKPFFFTDDIERLRLERNGPSTHENRAIGPLMKCIQRLGVCVPTDDWVESSQAVNHRRPMRVWRSLIYEGPKRNLPRLPKRMPIDPRQFDMWGAAY